MIVEDVVLWLALLYLEVEKRVYECPLGEFVIQFFFYLKICVFISFSYLFLNSLPYSYYCSIFLSVFINRIFYSFLFLVYKVKAG